MRKLKLSIVLCFSVLAIFSSCTGQNSNIVRGDTVSEIGKSIWSIFQDKNNVYWFGSNGQGVYRYDGKNLVQFTTIHGLCQNKVRTIQQDKAGNIYFNTDSGVSKFDGQAFTTLVVTASNEWKLQTGDLWFAGAQDEGVVYRYDGTTLHRLKFPATKLGDEFHSKFPRSKFPNMTFSPYDVYNIYKDSKGNIWFGTSSLGACCYDGKTFTWIDGEDLKESPVRSIVEDKNKSMWLGNSGEAIYRYDGKSLLNYRALKGIGNIKGSIQNLAVSYNASTRAKNGALWIATYEHGIWQYEGERVNNYTIAMGNSTIIYTDNKGEIWLGTNANGLYKFNGKSFEPFRL